jgi:hypothetical protein
MRQAGGVTMPLELVNPDPRYTKVHLIEAAPLGYLHLAADVQAPHRPGPRRSSIRPGPAHPGRKPRASRRNPGRSRLPTCSTRATTVIMPSIAYQSCRLPPPLATPRNRERTEQGTARPCAQSRNVRDHRNLVRLRKSAVRRKRCRSGASDYRGSMSLHFAASGSMMDA